MRYPQLPSQRTQPDGSLLLSFSVSGALRGYEIERNDRSELGWQIIEDLGATTAQLHPGHQAAKTDAHGPGIEFARRGEIEHRKQIVETILERRARQRPGARPFERFDDNGDSRFRILDPLGLIKDDNVPWAAVGLGLCPEIGADGFEIREVERCIGAPCRLPLVPCANRSGDRKVGSPNADLPPPLCDQSDRTDDQRAFDLSSRRQNAQGCDRLDGLA